MRSICGKSCTLLGVQRAHISGRIAWRLGSGPVRGSISRTCAARYFEHRGRNADRQRKGKAGLANLIEFSKKSAGQAPTYQSVLARMKWLMHEKNWSAAHRRIGSDPVNIYSRPEALKATALVQKQFSRNSDADLVAYEKIVAETLFLWTRDNPIHDVAAAKAACERTPNGALYVMEADAAHWPQYEAPDEFNTVIRRYLTTGEIGR